MFRITTTTIEPDQKLLKAEGAVRGEAVRAIRLACQLELAEGRPVVLDLTGVSFIDPAGVHCVRSLAAQGVQLRGGSPFVVAMLGESAFESNQNV